MDAQSTTQDFIARKLETKAEDSIIKDVGHARSFMMNSKVLIKVIAVELKGPTGVIKTYREIHVGKT